MSAQGFCLEVTYTGSGKFFVDDIHDAFDARNMNVQFRKPGPLYLTPNVPAALIYTSDVAKSFESGKIRRLITDGRATTQFIMGSAIGGALGFQQFDLDSAVSSTLVMTTSGRVAAETTTGAVFVYLPKILAGSAMAPVEFLISGVNTVTVYPFQETPPVDGVEGPAGSILVLDPLVDGTTFTFYPNSTTYEWTR